MAAKKVSRRGKLTTVMQEVSLQDLLKRARNGRSYSEMARLCGNGLSIMTIQRIETAFVELPNRATMRALSIGYGIPLDTLALAAYGVLFEEVPEGSDDTAPLQNDSAPADDRTAWTNPGRAPRRASALI